MQDQMSKKELNQLAMKAKEDKSSFALLYNYFLDRAFKYSYWKLGSVDKAEDAVSETFFKLLNKFPHYNVEKDFQPWFYTILRNTVNDELRKIYRNRRNHSVLNDPPSTDKTFEELGAEQDSVLQALSRLPDELKSVLEMLYFLEMSIEEVAAELGVSVKSVYRKRLKALKICQRFLSE